MACVALKRSHFDLQNTPTQDGCVEPNAKRRCSFAALSPCQSSPHRPYGSSSCSPIFQKPMVRSRILEDVNGEIRMIRRRRRHFARVSEETAIPAAACRKERQQPALSNVENECESPSKSADLSIVKPEKPVFTAKQVADFCQRKLKEREEELKVLFDQIMTERLTDQYDSFVRFTEDNLRRHFADRECSYVS